MEPKLNSPYRYGLYKYGEHKPFVGADDIDLLAALADIQTAQPLNIDDPFCTPDNTDKLEATPGLAIIDEWTGDVIREWDPVTPIESADFSVRTYNCLRRAHVRTIEQLYTLTIEDILKIRNLGRRSQAEIFCFLVNRNHPDAEPMQYRFGDGPEREWRTK